MDCYTQIELLKYSKFFIERGKIEIAKNFIIQIIRKTKNKRLLISLNEMLNCLNNKNQIYHQLVLDHINEIVKNEKELSKFFSTQDNPHIKYDIQKHIV
ncbi:MAG: hypothetical protein HFJ53_06675 [Clostridia bacterium]|nr:hypothetical protein [Clostridia bacterium]